ncbi:hypothetical protein M8C21_032497 [Ambrosia artemisiifolia]|uniref:Uncharacterized protein n=1 Tax=Ambrosia artemisiifolia TaxID=4212 RepID=A0AAD5BWY2_AMBAR|nr:hypothetical protein M8C21_032497 [Ambrosia artemisiifolia]
MLLNKVLTMVWTLDYYTAHKLSHFSGVVVLDGSDVALADCRGFTTTARRLPAALSGVVSRKRLKEAIASSTIQIYG